MELLRRAKENLFLYASRAEGGKCGVESAIMDANCRFINIVLNDNKVEQMF